jgi:hypothetical protein
MSISNSGGKTQAIPDFTVKSFSSKCSPAQLTAVCVIRTIRALASQGRSEAGREQPPPHDRWLSFYTFPFMRRFCPSLRMTVGMSSHKGDEWRRSLNRVEDRVRITNMNGRILTSSLRGDRQHKRPFQTIARSALSAQQRSMSALLAVHHAFCHPTSKIRSGHC